MEKAEILLREEIHALRSETEEEVAAERVNRLSKTPVAPGHHSSICHPPGLIAKPAGEIAAHADELDAQAEAIVAMADEIRASMSEEERARMKLSEKIRCTLCERSRHPKTEVPTDWMLEEWAQQAERLEKAREERPIDSERISCPNNST